jgi:type VI protein secretion system component VasK
VGVLLSQLWVSVTVCLWLVCVCVGVCVCVCVCGFEFRCRSYWPHTLQSRSLVTGGGCGDIWEALLTHVSGQNIIILD